MNQEQFDADNANESPYQLCTRRDWWHDFKANPVRKHFDQIRLSWGFSHMGGQEPTATGRP